MSIPHSLQEMRKIQRMQQRLHSCTEMNFPVHFLYLISAQHTIRNLSYRCVREVSFFSERNTTDIVFLVLWGF